MLSKDWILPTQRSRCAENSAYRNTKWAESFGPIYRNLLILEPRTNRSAELTIFIQDILVYRSLESLIVSHSTGERKHSQSMQTASIRWEFCQAYIFPPILIEPFSLAYYYFQSSTIPYHLFLLIMKTYDIQKHQRL